MPLQNVIDAITAYKNSVLSIFNSTKVSANQLPYINTNTDRFDVVYEPPINSVVLVNNNADLLVCMSELSGELYPGINQIFDATTNEVYTYTGSWSSSSSGYSAVIKPGRGYFNPVLKYFYHVDMNGVVRNVNFFNEPKILGIDWVLSTAPVNDWVSVTYGNGLFVAISPTDTGPQIITSVDGITWTSRTAPSASGWTSVTFGNGLFVAVAESGTNRVMTSPDGITWTNRTASSASSWVSVTFGGFFVAVASSGTNRVMTSPDGITWTNRTAAEANTWSSVTFGNGYFVAISMDGSNQCMRSEDGISWTPIALPSNGGVWLTVRFYNGLFIVVGSGVGVNGDRIATSADGSAWTHRIAPGPNTVTQWIDVVYGNGLFVLLGSEGAISISPDGITWALKPSIGDYTWHSGCYGNNRIVAVSSSDLSFIPTGAVMVSN